MLEQNKLLNRKQAADFLGVKEATLAHWKCTGRYNLPSVKIGRLVKYRTSDLEQFIVNGVCSYE
ncbi:DNA-binding protein [Candidatus Megaera venefica]|uniref:DNA-binding protein n=1 Tax=Candidatus Megaera venefica TaxID=2055910 RepID=A0ABU5NE77_9RICK|nr:helix-turn-helix domain-containing protein [Candidatus Megaera venefica]MEA0971475.1 DNA-binding protein [Candidatus Megaera venefica]